MPNEMNYSSTPERLFPIDAPGEGDPIAPVDAALKLKGLGELLDVEAGAAEVLGSSPETTPPEKEAK